MSIQPLIDPKSGDFDNVCAEFQWQVPETFNIADMICDRHDDLAEQTALFYENEAGDTARYTFGQIKQLSNQLANSFARQGINQGDRVAIVLPQRIETGLAHLAIYKRLAIAVPLSGLFGIDALLYRLRDSGAKMVITDSAHLELIESLRNDLPELETVLNVDGDDSPDNFWQWIERGDAEYAIPTTDCNTPALLIYTSGTTGPPKGAVVAHRCIYGNLTGFELSQNFFPQEGDVFWTPADWAWTGGLIDGLIPSWYYGKPILAYEGGKFDAEKACELMEKYQVRNAFIPPTALKLIRQINDIPTRYQLNLRSIMSAGEAMGAELYQWGKEVLGVEINEMWGQTEFNYLAGSCSALMPTRPGSMGKAYPGHRVEAIDEEGNILPPGILGELAAHIDDPVWFLGYWNKPDATAAKITGKWWRTGDAGYKDRDGYIWFIGRNDDVINSSGHRIGPGEIEDVILTHPAVQQVAVVGKPDELRGEIVKAYIIARPGESVGNELAENIKRHVKIRLAAHEYPREVEFIDELPMTTTGKVRRIELRERELRIGQRPSS
ncbi:MAG: AMP-binding protein [Thiolinea sp.]